MTKHKDILRDAAERGIRYREDIGARRVGPSVDDVAAVSAFDEVLTDDGCDAAALSPTCLAAGLSSNGACDRELAR